MLLICAKTITIDSHHFELVRLKKEEEEENLFLLFGDSGLILL